MNIAIKSHQMAPKKHPFAPVSSSSPFRNNRFRVVDTNKTTSALPQIFQIDYTRQLIGIVANQPHLTLVLDNEPQTPLFFRTIIESSHAHTSEERHFYIFWYNVSAKGKNITFQNKQASVSCFWEGKARLSISVHELYKKTTTKKLNLFSKVRKFIALLPFISRHYSNCWLLVDRDFKADDNAEHFYRWIQLHHPSQRIFFGLNKNSPDWARLKQENFNLVHLGGLNYFFAWFHSVWLISSNKGNYIRRFKWRRMYNNQIKHQFCFLQHGITDCYHPSFNENPADMLITATENEYNSFLYNPQYPYIFTKREVVLTGFPRHDALLAKAAKQKQKKIILFAPTWRKNLTTKQMPGTGQYPYSIFFSQSAYFKNWQSALQSQSIKKIAAQHGFSLFFFPHPYIRQQLSDFDLSDFTVTDDTGTSFQDTLASTALLITDYSSNATEAAYIKCPVIYFQFDESSFFSQDHSYQKGYFNYHEDGFGDIVTTPDELSAKVIKLIEKGCTMDAQYLERARRFFSFQDGQSCQRIYEALIKNQQPH